MNWIDAIFLCVIVGFVCWLWGKSNEENKNYTKERKKQEEIEKEKQELAKEKKWNEEKKQNTLAIIKDCLTELNLINTEEFCYGMYEAIKHKYCLIEYADKKILKRQIKSILQLNKKTNKPPRS